jgi:hypothetical protein
VALIDFFGQVSEASVSRNRSTIIVPAGSTRDEGWAAFRNILAEINEASRLFILPNQVSLFFHAQTPLLPAFTVKLFPVLKGSHTFSFSFVSLHLFVAYRQVLNLQNVLLGFLMM